MDNLCSVVSLKKCYKEKVVVNDLNFVLDSSEIVGFVGPNGSGKTTTIKIMLGLIRSNSGGVFIEGKELIKNIKECMRYVAGIVENPSMYEYLTAKQNLDLKKDLYSGLSKNDVIQVLKLVGLENRMNDKVKTYSLGMKQRLGIAYALLTNPRLLLLDEPMNGLDPEGINDLKKLLTSLKEKGMSILISSHILSELENFCDRILVIKNGIILGDHSLNENNKNFYIISTSDSKKSMSLLRDQFSVTFKENDLMIEIENTNILQVVIRKLINNDIEIYSVGLNKVSLENVYMQIAGGNVID